MTQSAYEKDRIVSKEFGQTEMGRDLLAQDYLLKQITASLIYPEEEIGKKFWKRIYEEAQKKYGTTQVPVNTFNKVWIVPAKAVVYENGKTAYVTETKLKVMLEEDYLSMSKHECRGDACHRLQQGRTQGSPLQNDVNTLGSQIIREIIIPALEKEVNEGKNFTSLRQVYNSLILANWYKKRLKDSILAQLYINKNKVMGVDIDDKTEANKIYQKYVEAFKKGVFNYISASGGKEDDDSITQETVPRKYFSGGVQWNSAQLVAEYRQGLPDPAMSNSGSNGYEIKVNLLPKKGDDAEGLKTNNYAMNTMPNNDPNRGNKASIAVVESHFRQVQVINSAISEDNKTNGVAWDYWSEDRERDDERIRREIEQKFEGAPNIKEGLIEFAYEGDQVVGYVMYKETDNPGQLNLTLLAVHPNFRGKYALDLMRKVFEEAIKLNKSEVILNVFNINARGINFYRRTVPRELKSLVAEPTEKPLEKRISKISGNVKEVIRFTYTLNRNLGGIDFNSDKMNLQVQNNSGEIKFNIDPAMLKQFQNASGFVPEIISLQPLKDIPTFLGVSVLKTPEEVGH